MTVYEIVSHKCIPVCFIVIFEVAVEEVVMSFKSVHVIAISLNGTISVVMIILLRSIPFVLLNRIATNPLFTAVNPTG